MNKEVLAAKKATVSEIENSLSNCGSLTIVSYHGLTVADITDLRHKLAEKGATMSVYKNTLVARALKDEQKDGLDAYLEGPNAFVFSKEISDGPAVLRKFAREHEELVIKGGYVEGKAYDGAGMVAIAKMPNKEGLLSMFCQVLNAPISGFARTIAAVAEKQGGAPAANEAAAQ